MDSQVYIIDDEPVVRKSMVALISSLGIATTSYSTAAEFLETFVDGEPARQCVIVDLRMPDMDGIQLKRELAARGANAPVVLLTGYCTDNTEEQALEAGVFDILEKPCRPDTLKALIDKAFDSIAPVSDNAVDDNVISDHPG